ncbi:hypothetical protein T484DRAFT_1800675 [Baffinella frigidus]|nr:hypothetical protein T484DRAFT_1800675 [Cryptophyta sp. CCMP2293]
MQVSNVEETSRLVDSPAIVSTAGRLGSLLVSDVEETSRLVDSPAIVSEHDNAVTRRMMVMEEFKSLGVTARPRTSSSGGINVKHPLLKSLHEVKAKDEAVAKMVAEQLLDHAILSVAEQLLDNAIFSAEILEGAREMIPRITKLMHRERLLGALQHGSKGMRIPGVWGRGEASAEQGRAAMGK